MFTGAVIGSSLGLLLLTTLLATCVYYLQQRYRYHHTFKHTRILVKVEKNNDHDTSSKNQQNPYENYSFKVDDTGRPNRSRNGCVHNHIPQLTDESLKENEEILLENIYAVVPDLLPTNENNKTDSRSKPFDKKPSQELASPLVGKRNTKNPIHHKSYKGKPVNELDPVRLMSSESYENRVNDWLRHQVVGDWATTAQQNVMYAGNHEEKHTRYVVGDKDKIEECKEHVGQDVNNVIESLTTDIVDRGKTGNNRHNKNRDRDENMGAEKQDVGVTTDKLSVPRDEIVGGTRRRLAGTPYLSTITEEQCSEAAPELPERNKIEENKPPTNDVGLEKQLHYDTVTSESNLPNDPNVSGSKQHNNGILRLFSINNQNLGEGIILDQDEYTIPKYINSVCGSGKNSSKKQILGPQVLPTNNKYNSDQSRPVIIAKSHYDNNSLNYISIQHCQESHAKMAKCLVENTQNKVNYSSIDFDKTYELRKGSLTNPPDICANLSKDGEGENDYEVPLTINQMEYTAHNNSLAKPIPYSSTCPLPQNPQLAGLSKGTSISNPTILSQHTPQNKETKTDRYKPSDTGMTSVHKTEHKRLDVTNNGQDWTIQINFKMSNNLCTANKKSTVNQSKKKLQAPPPPPLHPPPLEDGDVHL